VPSWITASVGRRVLNQTEVSPGDVRPQVSIIVGEPSSTEGGAVVTGIGIGIGSDDASRGVFIV